MSITHLEKLNKLCTLTKEHLLTEKIDLSLIELEGKSLSYSNIKKGTYKKKHHIKLENKNPFNPENSESYIKLFYISEKIIFETNSENYLVPKLSIGDKYFPIQARSIYTNEEKILTNEKNLNLIIFLGENSNLNLTLINSILIAYENYFDIWKNKIKVFTVNANKSYILELIEKYNWNKCPEFLEHLYISKEDKDYFKIYSIEYVTQLLIVNNEGFLKYNGTGNIKNIGKFVNDFLFFENNNIVEKKIEDKENLIEENNYLLLLEKFVKFENAFEAIYNSLNYNDYNMNLRLSNLQSFSYDLKEMKMIQKNSNPEIKFIIECFQNEYEIFSKLLAEFFTQEEIENNKLSVKLIDTFDIVLPEYISCNICQKVIDENGMKFFCYICIIFFCSECVKSKKKNKGFETLVHREHNLIAFQNPDQNILKNIEKYKLGKNLFASISEEELKREHFFGCDCCEKSGKYEERYICLTCEKGAMLSDGLIDICGLCIGNIHEDNQLDILENKSHKNNHIYLHLIYSGEDYFNY